MRERVFRLVEVEDEREAQERLPMNCAALPPGEVLMAAGGAKLQAAYEAAGVTCHTVEIGELLKAGGGVHCMTGFLKRDDL